MNDGKSFFRVAAAVPAVHLCDPAADAGEIISLMQDAAGKDVSLLVFPELCVTGYTCADLFRHGTLLDAAQKAVRDIAGKTSGTGLSVIIGSPVPVGEKLYDCFLFIRDGKIMGIIPRTDLSIQEKRWFDVPTSGEKGTVAYASFDAPFAPEMVFDECGVRVAVVSGSPDRGEKSFLREDADILVNPGACSTGDSPYRARRNAVLEGSKGRVFIHCNCGFGESTTDSVWDGAALICENGQVIAEGERFQVSSSLVTADVVPGECRPVPVLNPAASHAKGPNPFVPEDPGELEWTCRETFSAQAAALATRLHHTGCRKAVVGVSGGLDSTLAILVCARAFDMLGLDRKGIIALTMPGFGTSGRTFGNANALMDGLGVSAREISITEAVKGHFSDIGHSLLEHDATYENAQARERTQILMDVAGSEGGLVVGTGDLSEAALGWCTYNGDHMSMYNVNASVPKTLVRAVVLWAASGPFAVVGDTLRDIAFTPVSPELLPPSEGEISQVTEDIVGPYELHDFFIYHFILGGLRPSELHSLACSAFEGRYTPQVIGKWLGVFLKRFFASQFKRSCSPDGPKVSPVSLSPRGGWVMGSDVSSRLWTEELENYLK